VTWTAWELREEMQATLETLTSDVQIGDCLDIPYDDKPFDVAITNPPFSIAPLVLQRLLGISRNVVMLLRLNYMGSQKRVAFLRDHMPDASVLPNRPVFGPNKVGKLGTDSIEYAWFSWQAEYPQIVGRLILLNDTPYAERKQDLEDTWELVEGVYCRKPPPE